MHKLRLPQRAVSLEKAFAPKNYNTKLLRECLLTQPSCSLALTLSQNGILQNSTHFRFALSFQPGVQQHLDTLRGKKQGTGNHSWFPKRYTTLRVLVNFRRLRIKVLEKKVGKRSQRFSEEPKYWGRER